jgi:hypothetical protein
VSGCGEEGRARPSAGGDLTAGGGLEDGLTAPDRDDVGKQSFAEG